MAKNNSQKKRSRRQQQQQQGGQGGPTNALTVFGNMNEQKAASGNGNLIQMNGQSQSPNMNGGSFLGNLFGQGDNTQSQASPLNNQSPTSPPNNQSPTIPSAANNVAVTKSGGSKQSKQQLQKNILKQLKQLNQQGGNLNPISNQQLPNAQLPALFSNKNQMGGDPLQSQGNLLKGFMKAGGKLSKQDLLSLNQQLNQLQQQQQQGGVGLNEIVVPLILLYASQRYAQGKTMKKNTSSVRKSRRFTK
jgi:hypothetical protein